MSMISESSDFRLNDEGKARNFGLHFIPCPAGTSKPDRNAVHLRTGAFKGLLLPENQLFQSKDNQEHVSDSKSILCATKAVSLVPSRPLGILTFTYSTLRSKKGFIIQLKFMTT